MQSKKVACGQFVHYLVTSDGVLAIVSESPILSGIIHVSKGGTREKAKEILVEHLDQHGLHIVGNILKHK